MEAFNLSQYGLDERNLFEVSEWAKDYAFSKGILMKSRDAPKDSRILIPFCIIPSRIPKKWFDLACELQPYLNLVLFQISHSKAFLKECLASTIEADNFTASIFNLYEAVEQEQNEQLSLGWIRSDYLLDSDAYENVTGLKQVESNTISASFGSLAPSIYDLHKYILHKLGKHSFASELPENRSLNELAKGLIAAWEAYGNHNAIILFVVEEKETNIYDQKAVEYKIMELRGNIKICRHTLKDLRTQVELKEKALFVSNQEVAVVYYRTGYRPGDYEIEDWEVRLVMEKSSAVKCPSAGLHLAGTKRVQLQLTHPGVLEKFVHPDIAEKLRILFVNQYTLNMGKEGDEALKMGIENPYKYVLKPEREGGGNNIYGSDVKSVLSNIEYHEKRNAFILMERINPPSIPNCIVQVDKFPIFENIVCELGIFGVILGSKKEIMINHCAGHLLRSKLSFCDETGVAAGFGALDSPHLT